MVLDKRKIRKQWCEIHVNQSGYFTIVLEGQTESLAYAQSLPAAIERADKVLRRATKMRLWIPFTDMDTFRSKAVTGLHAQNGDYLIFDLESEESERQYRYSLHHELKPKDEIPGRALEVRIMLEQRRTRLTEKLNDVRDRINQWNAKYTIDVRKQVEEAVAEFEREHENA